jgi:hypothetical protein
MEFWKQWAYFLMICGYIFFVIGLYWAIETEYGEAIKRFKRKRRVEKMNKKIVNMLVLCIVFSMIIISFSVMIPWTATAIQSPITLVAEPTNPNRVPEGTWDAGYIMEQSDFKVQNGTFIGWYRGDLGSPGHSHIGYETSVDGVTWVRYSGNPILTDHWVLPYVVSVWDCYYLFAKNMDNGNIYLFNLTTNHVSPVPMNGGNPVLYHSTNTANWTYEIFNVAVEVVNNTWHMLIESRAQGTPFRMGYSYSNYSELNWTSHVPANAFWASSDAYGNPDFTYIPEMNAFCLIYGHYTAGKWEIRSGYANLSTDLTISGSWHQISPTIFKISNPGFHIADSDVVTPFNSTYGVLISYSWDQTDISQSYYTGTMLEFYEQLTGFDYTPPPTPPTPPEEISTTMLAIFMFVGVMAIGLMILFFAQEEKFTIEGIIIICLSIFIAILMIPMGMILLGLVIPRLADIKIRQKRD